MIIERQRGGERNDFDIPALKEGGFVDITGLVTEGFEKAVLNTLGDSVTVTFSEKVAEESKFYPLDRKVPQSLYPDLSEFVRTGTASTELRNFIAKVISVQATNVVQQVQATGHKGIEFNPADALMYVNTPARPIYAFLRRFRNEFTIETETSFLLFTPSPEVEEATAVADA